VTYTDKLPFIGVVGATIAMLAAPAQAAPSESPDAVPSFNGTVLAVAYSGSTVYVGGDFGTVGGQRRDSLARLDGRSGAVAGTLKHSIEGRPYALATTGGRLYLGGSITKVNGQSRTRLAAFNLTTGALDTKWKPTADDQVETPATGGGRVYAGGKFHKVNGTSGYDRLVALDPSSAAIVTGFKLKPPVITFAVAVTSTGVYTAHGGQGGAASSYSTTGVKRWTATFDGNAQAIDVLAMAVHPSLGALAVGGAFATIGGRSQKRFAQFG
jgi:hypothetical protein